MKAKSMERIYVALDTVSLREAQDLARLLKGKVGGVKLGKEFFAAHGPEGVDIISREGLPVFLDLKFHDIPTTVYKACLEAYKLGVWMLNIHLLGGEEMIIAAKEARNQQNPSALLIGVTLLTSHDDDSLTNLGFIDRKTTVRKLAVLADKCCIDCIVCSPSDLDSIKNMSPNFIYVTPGIRLDDKINDHAKIFTPQKALSAGSTYLVIGRPITEAKEPMKVIQKIISLI